MALRNIGIVYRKELRESLRDRRTLIAMIVMPLVLFPLVTVGFFSMVASIANKAKAASTKIMIIGGEDSPEVVADLKKLEKISVVSFETNWKDQIVNKQLPAAVEIPGGFQKDLADQKDVSVTIYDYSGELNSEVAVGKIQNFFNDYRDTVVKQRLLAKNLPANTIKPFDVKQQNVAPPEKSGAALFLGGFIAYIVVFLCFNGGMNPAIDLTAGEKERGTMETILSSPVSRTHLVLGKFLLVLTTALVTAAISVISMGVSFAIAAAAQTGSANNDASFTVHIGVGAALSVLVMALPLAVLFASVLITIASFAKTNKEAQSYIVPLIIVVIVPAIAAMLPGIDLNPKLALVPILNVSLLCKELVIGIYHWNYIAIIFSSTCVYAAIALFLAVKMFQRESILFRS